jgi:hypothetical protein
LAWMFIHGRSHPLGMSLWIQEHARTCGRLLWTLRACRAACLGFTERGPVSAAITCSKNQM